MRIKSKSLEITTKKRDWDKVIAPLIRYNRKSTQFGNPIDFAYHLQQIVKQGYQINLNIPHTLTGAHDNCLQTQFQYAQQKIGKIIYKPNISKTKFSHLIANFNKNQSTNNISSPSQKNDQLALTKSHWLPFVIIKQKNEQDSSTYIWNIHEYQKANTIQSNQIAQTYIFTKNPSFISIIRFFYVPGKKNQSVAYSIENLKKISEARINKSQWKVMEHLEKSCFHLKIMYQNKQFYEQTLQLIDVLSKFMHQEVHKIVTDWIVDPNGRYYLIDIKQIQFYPYKKPIQSKKGNIQQLLSVVTCSMCLLNFHPNQITNVLTNNLIDKFDRNLKKRQIDLSFKINMKKIIDFSKVCNLCYCLVVKQHELIQLQKQFGWICNTLKLDKNRQRNRKDIKPISFDLNQKKIHPATMYQWRLFIYVQELLNSETVLKKMDRRIYLHLKINNVVTTFIIPKNRKIIVRGIKLIYLFSEKAEVYDYFRKTGIDVQLSLNKFWGNPLAQGCVHTLYNQQQILAQAIFQRKNKEILLFTNSAQYSTLGLCIGLVRDTHKNTQNLNLQKIQDIYVCSEQYSDCQEFPPQWMQLIDPKYQLKLEQYVIDNNKTVIESIMSKLRRNSSRNSKLSYNHQRQSQLQCVQNIQNSQCSKKTSPYTKKQSRLKSKSSFPPIEHRNKNRKKLVL